MSRLILSQDIAARKQTRLVDGPDGIGTITEQNVDHILRGVRHKAAIEAERRGRRPNTQRHVQHIAEIPATLYFDWCQEYGRPDQNPTKWKQLLNDPEYAYLRTGGGRL